MLFGIDLFQSKGYWSLLSDKDLFFIIILIYFCNA